MAADTKIRIGHATLSESLSPSQTLRLRDAHPHPQISRHSGQIVFTGSRASNESFLLYRPTTKFRPRPRTQSMATLPFRNAGVSPALLSFCSRLYTPLPTRDPLLASPGDACTRRRHVGLLIYGFAIKCLGKSSRINHLRISNRRLKRGLRNRKMQPILGQRT
jgi:hypothetical protein